MKMNIKDIVEQVQETPSPRCWESIASQLPAAGTAIGGGAAATAAKGALSAGKLAAIIGSAATAVIVITGTTIALLTHEPSTEQQVANQSHTTIIMTDSTAMEDHSDAESSLLLCQAEAEQISPAKEKNVASSTTSTSEKNIVEEESVTTPAANTLVHSAASNPATPSPTANIPTPNTSSTISSSNITSALNSHSDKNSANDNSSTPTPATATQTHQNSNINATTPNEEWSFSQPVVIEIPNIFTPNGDGVNDQFVINGIESCEKRALIVKNQNGQTVFQSSRYDNTWDGGNLPDGTYYYQFNYSINNINELRRGTILIRR